MFCVSKDWGRQSEPELFRFLDIYCFLWPWFKKFICSYRFGAITNSALLNYKKKFEEEIWKNKIYIMLRYILWKCLNFWNLSSRLILILHEYNMSNCNTSKFKSKMLSDLQERTSSIEFYGKAFISITGSLNFIYGKIFLKRSTFRNIYFTKDKFNRVT